MDWLFRNLTDWLAKSAIDAIDQLLKWSVDVSAPLNYWRDAYAGAAHTIVLQVAWSLLTMRLVYEILRLYIWRDISDSIIGPSVIFRRLIITAFWVSVTGPAVGWIFEFSYGASRAIAGTGADHNTVAYVAQRSALLISNALTPGVVVLNGLILIAFAAGLLFLKFQAAIRGVELMIAYVFGPVFALSALGSDDFLTTGTLAAWWREVLVCTLAQVVQTLILVALANYALSTAIEMLHILMLLPILWVAIKSPTILRQYAYHSGVGQGATRGAASGASMMLMRFATKMPF